MLDPAVEIRAYFPSNLVAMLKALYLARPDLAEAWFIMAVNICYTDPEKDLGIKCTVVINNQ